MRATLLLALMLSLLAIDWLMFHDLLKGEHYTPVQLWSGLVSLPLLAVLASDLARSRG